MSKKIVVFAVTGDQGTSVAKYLSKDGKYEVVGITRSPESDKAKALAALGVKLAKGDLNDPESYKSALQGVYGGFVNADFWEPYFAKNFDAEAAKQIEKKQSSGAIKSLSEAGAKHIVFSTLDPIEYVPHCSSKTEVAEWARKEGYPITELLTSHYISNLIKFGMLKKNEDGTLVLNIPAPDETPMVNFAPEQTGAWVTAILNNPDEYLGKLVAACSEEVTIAQWAKVIQDLTGRKTTTLGVDPKSFIEQPEQYDGGAKELYLNLKGFYEKKAPRDIEASKKINSEQWDTKAWYENTEALKNFLSS